MSTAFFVDLISHFKGKRSTFFYNSSLPQKNAKMSSDQNLPVATEICMYRDVSSCISLALLARFYNYIKKCVHLTTAARRSVAMQQRDNVGLGSSSKGSPPMPFSLSPSLSLSYCAAPIIMRLLVRIPSGGYEVMIRILQPQNVLQFNEYLCVCTVR